jgi:hypothetical protein
MFLTKEQRASQDIDTSFGPNARSLFAWCTCCWGPIGQWITLWDPCRWACAVWKLFQH